ncbi:MAG: Rrf2 family transcriptional regulator [Rhizobacter sp.]|nr:Rrf2 family transcriptional regulator [Bacteriovorax sp.]
MILGNQVEWALHCMTVLARMPEETLVSSKVLAEFHGVPKEYLSKAMQALAAAGLVHTQLGPRGGYSLSRPANKISMLDIVEAVEGDKKTFNCQEIRRNNPCTNLKTVKLPVCNIAAVMYQADNAWRDVLRKKKLSDVIADLKEIVPRPVLDKSLDWVLGKS